MTLSSTLLPSYSFLSIHAYAWILGKDDEFKQPASPEFRERVMIALDNDSFRLAGASCHAILTHHENWQFCGTYSLIRAVGRNQAHPLFPENKCATQDSSKAMCSSENVRQFATNIATKLRDFVCLFAMLSLAPRTLRTWWVLRKCWWMNGGGEKNKTTYSTFLDNSYLTISSFSGNRCLAHSPKGSFHYQNILFSL